MSKIQHLHFCLRDVFCAVCLGCAKEPLGTSILRLLKKSLQMAVEEMGGLSVDTSQGLITPEWVTPGEGV